MNSNIKPSDRLALLAVVDPDVTTASTVTTGWVSAANHANFMAVIMAGTLGSSATLDAKLEQATSSGGAGAKDVTDKAITQLTQAGSDSDTQAIINCRADELDISNDFAYLRLSVTVGTATSDIGALLFGLDAREQPVTQPAEVVEAV